MTAPYLRPAAPVFAFTAGFVDTVGYMGLFGLFTAHVTGNLVVIGASFAGPNAGLIAKLSALPVFITVVAITSLFIRRCGKAGHSPVRRLFAAQAILLAVWKTMPNTRTAALIKLTVYTGTLLLMALAAYRGTLPRTRPIVPGELMVAD